MEVDTVGIWDMAPQWNPQKTKHSRLGTWKEDMFWIRGFGMVTEMLREELPPSINPLPYLPKDSQHS
uniref:Protein kinase domain-containing protein n=1 Tax=Steinernema glaseri TaxID=37863 RepID=A0A1I8A0F1_9BILA